MSKQNTVNTVLKVDGMTCSHCDSSVESTFKRIDGVIDAKANHKEGIAVIQYIQEKTGVQEIIEAFNKLSHYRAGLAEKEASS